MTHFGHIRKSAVTRAGAGSSYSIKAFGGRSDPGDDSLMTFRAPLATTLLLAALPLWLAAPSIASAQDVMQLDLDFKNSLSQRSSPEVREERRNGQAWRHKARDAEGLAAEKKRHARRRRAEER
jgi:hypothetical protein